MQRKTDSDVYTNKHNFPLSDYPHFNNSHHGMLFSRNAILLIFLISHHNNINVSIDTETE